mmetsp:Transcript_22980/g.33334  ORF Transcript_22980/g.33334 Transcript_22980/m.33334 type:complete len:193 (-) Transcript_22980:23-601(-)|eukprot:CAMPEP_0113938396 /NCGR_PEP_ID=MMETSP1339-20121228/4827_1 /TAXON_ID=94617 /ORGANISM="Fibrocapsa japonica" /LENGTH=192 /DNA_ID=CAMNT_0000941491 /DNA_START=152 /DNA_END=730 /DNA_ORIENTATION=- /assembly_acc=CAM_ASM_000762
MGNVTPISIIEDIFHETGLDKAVVHRITGGKRFMERDGRISPELIEELEKTFDDLGLSDVVKVATGGSRVVNTDGSFNPEGMVQCAASIAALAADATGTVASARAFGLIQKKMIEMFIQTLEEICSEAGKAAREMQKINTMCANLEGMVATVNTLIAGPTSDPIGFPTALLALKDIPVQLIEIGDYIGGLES